MKRALWNFVVIPGVVIGGGMIFTAAYVPPAPRPVVVSEAQLERQRQGLHCLSVMSGTNSSATNWIKANLRDPGSYEHVATQVWPNTGDGQHAITVQYRARNGFGGMTGGVLTGRLNSNGCDLVSVAQFK